MESIVTNCRFCSLNMIDCIHLGNSFPLAGGFMSHPDEFKYEKTYQLSLSFCKNCCLLQCKQYIDTDILFKNNYYYFSSMIPLLVSHFNKYADMIADLVDTPSKYTVVEMGCNDGVLIRPLQKKGFKVIGIDPSHTVKKCIEDGFTIYNTYFNEKIADVITSEHGKCDFFLSSNSFAHIHEMGSIMNGIKALLVENGLAIIEVHYSKLIIDELQFDFIYHEHMSYYNVTSFYNIAKIYNMSLERVEFINIHGTSIRIFLRNTQNLELSNTIKEIINKEDYLYDMNTYSMFDTKLQNWKTDMLKILNQYSGKKIYGYGSSGRTNIILRFLDLKLDELIDDAPSKIGTYSPIYHNKIISSQIILDSPPDLLIIFAWTYKDDILNNIKKIYKGTFLIPLPVIQLIDTI